MTSRDAAFHLHLLYLPDSALQAASHSGQASATSAWILAMQAPHSSSTLGTLPNRAIISSWLKWETALHPHCGHDVLTTYFFLPDMRFHLHILIGKPEKRVSRPFHGNTPEALN
jgi:hypothetical protein